METKIISGITARKIVIRAEGDGSGETRGRDQMDHTNHWLELGVIDTSPPKTWVVLQMLPQHKEKWIDMIKLSF